MTYGRPSSDPETRYLPSGLTSKATGWSWHRMPLYRRSTVNSLESIPTSRFLRASTNSRRPLGCSRRHVTGSPPSSVEVRSGFTPAPPGEKSQEHSVTWPEPSPVNSRLPTWGKKRVQAFGNRNISNVQKRR